MTEKGSPELTAALGVLLNYKSEPREPSPADPRDAEIARLKVALADIIKARDGVAHYGNVLAVDEAIDRARALLPHPR